MFTNFQDISHVMQHLESEIVIPLIKDGTIIGVLDIDSPIPNRFDETDQRGLEDSNLYVKYFIRKSCTSE